jgi:hypothetical protein
MALPYAVIILFIILGAAASVCVGFAVQRLFNKHVSDSFEQKQPAQEEYMREVRQRNQMLAYAEARTGRHSRQDLPA